MAVRKCSGGPRAPRAKELPRGAQDKESVDPTRVGGPTNHLLSDGGLSLVIGDATKGTGNAALTQAIRRAQDRGGNPDRGLLVAFGHIGRLCTALGLVKSIQDRACEVFRDYFESKSIRGRGLAAVCAAVVYIACRCGARCCNLARQRPQGHSPAGRAVT